MEVKVYTGGEGLNALRQPWDELLPASRADNVFATHLWLSTWWECFGAGREPLIVTVWQDGQLAGLAPLTVSSREGFREVSLMGGRVSDYKDILIADGEDRYGVLGLLLHHVVNRRGIDLVGINGLREDSPNFGPLKTLLSRHGPNGAVLARYANAPYVSTRGTWNTYLHSLGQMLRKKTRRQWARLGEAYGDVSFGVAQTPEQVRDGVNRLLTLKVEQLRQRHGSGLLEGDNTRRFYHLVAQRLLERGWLRLHGLRVDAVSAAIDLGIEFQNKYYSCQHAYDPQYRPYSVGKLLDLHILEDGFTRGLREVDLLLGMEDYKLNYRPGIRHLYNGLIFQLSARGKLAQAWFTGVRPRFTHIARASSPLHTLRHLVDRFSIRYN